MYVEYTQNFVLSIQCSFIYYTVEISREIITVSSKYVTGMSMVISRDKSWNHYSNCMTECPVEFSGYANVFYNSATQFSKIGQITRGNNKINK